MSNTNTTKEQVFKAFSERRIGYIKALNLLGYDDYSVFLDEYFQAGYDYPDATKEEKNQAIQDYFELQGLPLQEDLLIK